MTSLAWVVACAAVFAGAVVQGSIGFGVAVVAAPILVMLDPAFVPGPMLALGTTLSIAMAMRDRRTIDPSGLGWALLGRLPGTVAGALVAGILSARAVSILVGTVVLLAVATSLGRPWFAPTARTLLGAGAVSGFMGTASSIGGPPMALVYQSSTGPQLRAALSGYFAIGSVVSLVALVAVGKFGAPHLRHTGVLVAPLLVGLLASKRVTPFVDRGRTRAVVLALCAVSAVVLLARQVL